ncbi:PH domain-containing protein [Lysobacter sp. A421]
MSHDPATGPVEPVDSPDRPGRPDVSAWQPLPPRSRALFLLGTVPALALAGLAPFAVIAAVIELSLAATIATAALGAALGGGFGLWLGLKQYRHTFWRLDENGLALRRGRLWQHETRVPASRVQHLDIKRGPLQRRRQLATLVVHTAGTRHSAMTVPNLDADDAERLRDRLGHQIDDGDDD